MPRSLISNFVVLSFAALALPACAPVIAGAAATSGLVLAQERSVGNAIDDFTIQNTISTRLYDVHPTEFRQIDMDVVEGRVLVTGRVPSQDRRIDFTRVAWQTDGVTEVINELEVSDQNVGFIRPRDTWISTRLRARLIGDPDIRQINYHIETLRGTVYLFGIAQSRDELARATEHAETLNGVDRVVSHMRIKDERQEARAANY